MAPDERRVDAGELHYSDRITIQPEDVTEDGSFEYPGTELTLDEALEAMITISDNGAARALWHLLGGENIDATLGMSVLNRRPHPDERPRWERVRDFAESVWGQPVTLLFFLNSSNGSMPASFVQALLAMRYRPIPVSGEKDQKVVARADMVKGYEFEKDHFVLFTPEELKALEEGSSPSIDIVAFIPEKGVDPIFYDKAYLLAPDKRGGKPYALLAEAMRSSGRCALAKWAWKGKQYVVQVRPVEDGLCCSNCSMPTRCAR